MVRIVDIKYSGNPFADALREVGYVWIGHCITSPTTPMTLRQWQWSRVGTAMVRVADFLDGGP